MMADLTLKGNLNLAGNLALNPDGGKVLIGDGGLEALLEAVPPGDPHHGLAPPVILPPPPGTPVDPKPEVWVVNSFNKTVTVGTPAKAIVALGMVLQGGQSGTPIWPGNVLPGQNSTVMANFIPINVLGDQAIIFPSGGTAMLNANSGQTG
jgi:hypothetical protein